MQSYDSSSAQATVFFGREPLLGIKVVLKQYKRDIRGFNREIKLFTELEGLKKRQCENDAAILVQDKLVEHAALPHLLSYSVAKDNDVAEILMINGGKDLAYWR